MQNTNLTSPLITNPFDPQGPIATVTGIVTYEGGITRLFRATLESVDGEWKITEMNVKITPE